MHCSSWLCFAVCLGLSWAAGSADMFIKQAQFDFTRVEDGPAQNRPTLLRGFNHAADLQCLRLYSGNRFSGAWSDMCSSNELLSHYNIFNTDSACAPKDQFWQKKRYWLLFAEPAFRGQYIILSEQECVRNMRRAGLPTLGSVLVCNVDSVFGSNGVRCTFPQKPWRTFQPLSDFEAREAVERAVQMQNRVSAVSVQVGGEDPEGKFSQTALDKLKSGAISLTNDNS